MCVWKRHIYLCQIQGRITSYILFLVDIKKKNHLWVFVYLYWKWLKSFFHILTHAIWFNPQCWECWEYDLKHFLLFKSPHCGCVMRCVWWIPLELTAVRCSAACCWCQVRLSSPLFCWPQHHSSLDLATTITIHEYHTIINIFTSCLHVFKIVRPSM